MADALIRNGHEIAVVDDLWRARSAVDASKIGQHLGWRPEIGLGAGLEETLRYFGAV